VLAIALSAALIVTVLYLLSGLILPYGPCLACAMEGLAGQRGGRGRNKGSRRKRYGRCRACKGTGERDRGGTRIIRAWSGGKLPR
jgi:hypothetical protein